MAAAVPPGVAPPVEPMLARLARDIPEGPYAYEPKWDGFRCLAFVSAPVDLRSRHDRPLARYFPEIVEALRALPAGTVIDGELVARGAGGFGALLARLHPAASRVRRLRDETPARLVAFDCLADAGVDVTVRPFAERRTRLEALLRDAPAAVAPTPLTRDPGAARAWLDSPPGAGIDGVVAKALDLPYQPGRRAMVKVKRERTADCVLVAGMRLLGSEPAVGSLLLGLYDPAGRLRHVGVSSSFRDVRRRELFEELRPLATTLAGHPWESGFNVGPSPVGRLAGSAGRWDPREMTQDWVALRPERVCEVGYDALDDGRFWHPARLVRWRPDRDPASCTFEQLVVAA